MFGKLFRRRGQEIDRFAFYLADQFYGKVKPEDIKSYVKSESSPAAVKVDRQIRDVATQIQQFRSINKMGVYAKARLHLTFAERLQELGFEEKMAKKINETILLKTGKF